jgi:hypothetical protein
LSGAPITLYCLSDVHNKTTVNINLLSHLEKPRIEYLVSMGTSFSVAKKQAEQEVLAIFNIVAPNIPESELLDITHVGTNNGILLAVSLILQGYRTEAELSNLLASISYDLKTDGVLTDGSLGTALINDAKYLHLDSIRSNIQSRWNVLGITDSIPGFEFYINNFITQTNYLFTNFITYPASSIYGPNILNTTDSIFPAFSSVSIAVNLPRGAFIKVAGDYNAQVQGVIGGWEYIGLGPTTYSSVATGFIYMMTTLLPGNGSVSIYENGSTTPSRIKQYTAQ